MATTLAGCDRFPAGLGGDDVPSYAAWLGPRTTDVYRSPPVTPDDADLSVSVRAPRRAVNLDELSSDMRSVTTTTVDHIRVAGPVTVDVDATAVDTFVSDFMETFAVVDGSFDGDAVLSALPDRATTRTDHLDHDVVTFPEDPDGEGERRVIGVGVGANHLVIATENPDAGTAVSNVERLLDTKAGDGTRFAARDGPTATVIDEFGECLFANLFRLGSDSPSGVCLSVDGETARRKSIRYFESEDRASEHWLTNETEIARLRTPVTDGEERAGFELFAPYESVEVTQTGRRVAVTGTLPVEDLAPIDVVAPERRG